MTFTEQYADALQRAAENVSNHGVREVCGVRNEDGEFVSGILRCTDAGSSVYGFDLAISRFGIAMYGDTDSLVFHVGSSYGIEFLARKSVCHYMISKLEEEFRKKTEVDEAALRAVLVDAGLRLMDETMLGDPPDWFEDAKENGGRADQLDSLIDWMEKAEEQNDEDSVYCDWLSAVDDVLNPNYGEMHKGIQVLTSYMYDRSGELNLGDCSELPEITKYSERLITNLEMLRLCAHKWQEQENDRKGASNNPGAAG